MAVGTMLRQLHRIFYTSIPTLHMEKMITGLPLALGLELDSAEKDLYHVKVYLSYASTQGMQCTNSIKLTFNLSISCFYYLVV